ncbi:hypothetical protein EXIGLDRAFT_608612, partial [Exidia glandulosa HHB12029]
MRAAAACSHWNVIEINSASIYPPEAADTEFKQKHAPDVYGDEAATNARVWRIYREHAPTHDQALLDGWHNTLDILLIFAGLFSAVLTTLLIESYHQLQPDYTEYIATALYTVLAQNTSSGVIPRGIALPSPQTFTPSTTSVWVNGLWFTSLMISLSVSLLCILAKQWLKEY